MTAGAFLLRLKVSNAIKRALLYGVLAFGAITVTFPFAWMVLTSFKTYGEAIASPPVFIPQAFSARAQIIGHMLASHPILIPVLLIWAGLGAYIGWRLRKGWWGALYWLGHMLLFLAAWKVGLFGRALQWYTLWAQARSSLGYADLPGFWQNYIDAWARAPFGRYFVNSAIMCIVTPILILATGATTRMIPGVQVSDNVVTYEEQILDENLPGSIVIAGSGAIGVEFAYVMANFGVDVTIVEFLDRMVPTEDAEVSKELARHYKKLGVKVLTSTKVESVEDTGSGVKVTVSPAAGGDSQVLEADRLLSAIGFAPRLEGYGLDAIGVETTERGAIAIDGRGRTNVENVYAIGDVTGKLMLAHTAEAMGIVAAETIAGAETQEIDFDFIPRATYCHPQIASMGYSEEQAKEKGFDVKVAKFPFSANGKAMGLGEGVGFAKIVADAEHNEIIGAHIIGPDATELLPILNAAQTWDLTADELSRVVFAHPTLGEAVKEALHGIAGHMINL